MCGVTLINVRPSCNALAVTQFVRPVEKVVAAEFKVCDSPRNCRGSFADQIQRLPETRVTGERKCRVDCQAVVAQFRITQHRVEAELR